MFFRHVGTFFSHFFSFEFLEEAQGVEAGADRRPLRRQDHRAGQAVNILREPGMEGLQVKNEKEVNRKIFEFYFALLHDVPGSPRPPRCC